MTTELTIGAINPGYGGLPIGVAAALGGATLAWHAHPCQPFDYAGRMIMRYHHPRASAYISVDAPPPMVDVLTINGFSDWWHSYRPLLWSGHKPPMIVVEVHTDDAKARPICEYLNERGYRTAPVGTKASYVGAPHDRYREYAVAVRKDCEAPTVNEAYLDAEPYSGVLWPTPIMNNASLLETACQWALDDLDGHPDKARTQALEHWAKVTGEPYPYPLYTAPTPEQTGSLSLGFLEWMMGLPIGYVSTPNLPIARAERRHLLQTGTVPLQAAHAVAVGLKQMGDQ